jgi:hypothetical protein
MNTRRSSFASSGHHRRREHGWLLHAVGGHRWRWCDGGAGQLHLVVELLLLTTPQSIIRDFKRLIIDDFTINQKIFQALESTRLDQNPYVKIFDAPKIWSRWQSRCQNFLCHPELIKFRIPTLKFLLRTEEILALIRMKILMWNRLQIVFDIHPSNRFVLRVQTDYCLNYRLGVQTD